MPPIKLSQAHLKDLDPARIALPGYDRARIKTGVIHIGPGAFHRAHQASYFDRLLNTDPGFGIIGVSMRSSATARALAPQDGLYVLAQLDETVRYRIIGAMRTVVMADDPALEAHAAGHDLKIISLTVTEKGYCLNPDGSLDMTHADIERDLAAEGPPISSAIGLVVHLLAIRYARDLAPPDVISCDNVPGNGSKLRAAVLAFAERKDQGLARWIAGGVQFPNTMVDAITPASDDALTARIAEEAGIDDAAPVQREAFCDWVLGDHARHAAALKMAGAVITDNVAGYEAAKLRMLNGAHSTLAYRGLARGHETVAAAMADAALAGDLEVMMRDEIAPSLAPPTGLDLDQYGRALRARFANPAIAHRLAQIAHDGSLKVPIRLLGTIADNAAAGRSFDKLALSVAGWMRFVRRAARDGAALIDPISDDLRAIGNACTDEPKTDVARFLTLTVVFPEELTSNTRIIDALCRAYSAAISEET